MARLIQPEGAETPTRPGRGSRFDLAELERLLDTHRIEILPLANGESMVIDFNGKMRGLPKNAVASRRLEEEHYADEGICGPVLVLSQDELPELKTSLRVHYG